MPQQICFFQDYLSELSPSEKLSALKQSEVELAASLDRPFQGDGHERVSRGAYRALVENLRHSFGRNAPDALSALLAVGPEAAAVRNLSERSREALYSIRELGPESASRISSWALDPANWYLVESPESPVTLQSRIWAKFPCIVFANIPIECAADADPELKLDRIEDILQATGIHDLWKRGHLGEAATSVVLDTGVSSGVVSSSGVQASAVAGLSSVDADGHGTAVIGLIQALSPKTAIESICVSQSFSGGQIWNLIAGLTTLYSMSGAVVNLSLGVSPDWIRSLGPQSLGFKEALSNVLGSLAANGNFAVSAAGNDGLADLRWPAACPDALAVGSHNPGFGRSSFSNFRAGAQNLILAPGGDVRQMDQRIEGFGQYGRGLTREVYGTSFSTAIASAMACLLMDCNWFAAMAVGSRISLFRNHCRQNGEGFPILNAVDIGAVWPI